MDVPSCLRYPRLPLSHGEASLSLRGRPAPDKVAPIHPSSCPSHRARLCRWEACGHSRGAPLERPVRSRWYETAGGRGRDLPAQPAAQVERRMGMSKGEAR